MPARFLWATMISVKRRVVENIGEVAGEHGFVGQVVDEFVVDTRREEGVEDVRRLGFAQTVEHDVVAAVDLVGDTCSRTVVHVDSHLRSAEGIVGETAVLHITVAP